MSEHPVGKEPIFNTNKLTLLPKIQKSTNHTMENQISISLTPKP
jgi:hypothetical protein